MLLQNINNSEKLNMQSQFVIGTSALNAFGMPTFKKRELNSCKAGTNLSVHLFCAQMAQPNRSSHQKNSLEAQLLTATRKQP
jgi:hypothetical protein